MLDDIKINVVRKKRKTASIYIERDGSVSVYVPESLDKNEIDGLLADQEYRIRKLLAKQEVLNISRVERSQVNGESYLYLGRNYYLQYVPELTAIQLKGKNLLAPEEGKQDLKPLFREFYRKEGLRFIPPKAMDFAAKMSVKLEEVAVLDLKNRWASCSMKKAKLNFHWKVMMAPVSVIDYLIIHELVHFKHKRHDSLFWNEVDKLIPNHQEKVDWLKRYGAGLDV